MMHYSSPRAAVMMRFTRDLASLSKCTDRKVAAIITNKEGTQVFSIGVNGGPAGGIQCLCTLGGKYTCIHAEANAIAKCTSTEEDKIMFCTLSPCVTCAALIQNNGIKAVYYLEDYKDTAGVDLLRGLRVACHKMIIE